MTGKVKLKTYILSVYGYDNMRIPITAESEEDARQQFSELVEILED